MVHLCSMMVLFFMILFLKIFGVEYLSIFDDHYLTTIWSVAFTVNFVARFAWNKAYESTVSIRNKKLVLFVMNGILCILVATLSATYFLDSDILYAVWIVAMFAVMGCDWILYPSLIAITFGQNYSGHVMGYMALADIPALLIVVVVANHIYAMDSGESWEGFTWIIAAFLVFSTILVVVLDPLKVIAERESKNTIKATQFPSYHSNDSVVDEDQTQKTSCGCGPDCACECK